MYMFVHVAYIYIYDAEKLYCIMIRRSTRGTVWVDSDAPDSRGKNSRSVSFRVEKFRSPPLSRETSPLENKSRLGLNSQISRFLLCQSGGAFVSRFAFRFVGTPHLNRRGGKSHSARRVTDARAAAGRHRHTPRLDSRVPLVRNFQCYFTSQSSEIELWHPIS